ncbi:MAG: glutamate-5-semialdehyde dehydrogenase [Spirochaetales bacterium]|jgi:glutamate-5-semialdehyde dehydrogenase|nr:glutamate-5-semialdehyde dehydrogenase [Spirochaetales bacterium]
MSAAEDAAAAKRCSPFLAALSAEKKNEALAEIRAALLAGAGDIAAANRRDVLSAREAGLAAPLVKRLQFDEAKLIDACAGITSLAGLDDPVGRVLSARELDEGLKLYQVSCPIGVVGVIFESRPDALIQISCLCLKSGNAVILKGGREAAQTNRVLFDALLRAGRRAGLPDGWAALLETREDVAELLSLGSFIDLIIPRGSNEFVRHIMKNTSIPVMGHADGICHIYIDEGADFASAEKIVVDSKTQYPAVCNAVETLLVHERAAREFLPGLAASLQARGVTLKGCGRTQKIISCEGASEEDWRTEYLDLILSVKIVSSLEEAASHINFYGSGHTDCIVSSSSENAGRFMAGVDSANVFWNASTRFADGYRYGLGAEVGISTARIHARGPVGLEGLVIYKWRLYGEGHCVAPYAEGQREFTHRVLPKELP